MPSRGLLAHLDARREPGPSSQARSTRDRKTASKERGHRFIAHPARNLTNAPLIVIVRGEGR